MDAPTFNTVLEDAEHLQHLVTLVNFSVSEQKVILISHWSKTEQEGDDEQSGYRFHTANEGPVRIQYKCLVPSYYCMYSQTLNCYFKNRLIMFCLPVLHSHICERFLYFQNRSAYSAARKYVYINGVCVAVDTLHEEDRKTKAIDPNYHCLDLYVSADWSLSDLSWRRCRCEYVSV